MAEETVRGICPHCGGEGQPVGAPCTEQICRRQGYHYIPERYAADAAARSAPGAGSDPEIGRKIDRYLLVGVIGKGGMGAVYLALQMPLEREVALKVIAGISLDPTSQGRFEREAKAISILYHPNIVQLFEYGFNPVTGAPFMAIEYVKGGRELLAEMQRLRDAGMAWDPPRVDRIFGQVLSALQTAHDKGMVHRDIKPQNIMLVDIAGNPDFVKILDFGLARTFERIPGLAKLTGTGAVVGTPQYMAPEQLMGKGEVDHRADLYGVGAVLFEVATGLGVYPGLSPRSILSLKLEGEYEPLDRLPHGAIHPPLEELIRRAMARDPDLRFSSADEMRATLKHCLVGAPPLGLVRIGEEPAEGLGGRRPVTADPMSPVDPTGATIASDESIAPHATERITAVERPAQPGPETLEEEMALPGRGHGRLMLLGTVTGIAIVAAALAVIFVVVLPRLEVSGSGTGQGGEGPARDAGALAAADAGPEAAGKGQALAGAGDAGPALPWEILGEGDKAGEDGKGDGKKHAKHGTDASIDAPVDGTGTQASEDPALPDQGVNQADAGGPADSGGVADTGAAPDTAAAADTAAASEPVTLSGPPLKAIHAKLKALSQKVKACLPQPQGQVTVTVTFSAGTGKASAAKVGGFFPGGESTSACIEGAAMSLEVQAWEGEDVSVPYSYGFDGGDEAVEEKPEGGA